MNCCKIQKKRFKKEENGINLSCYGFLVLFFLVFVCRMGLKAFKKKKKKKCKSRKRAFAFGVLPNLHSNANSQVPNTRRLKNQNPIDDFIDQPPKEFAAIKFRL